MFTGIVGACGVVTSATRRDGLVELEVKAPTIAPELAVGDSVALNGVCLTATKASRKRFRTQVTRETLDRSSLGRLRRGARVNLELASKLNDRLGGHLVQGHVDGLAQVVRMHDENGSKRVWLEADGGVLKYIVAKGSVALDGVSLTVAEAGTAGFAVALVPHTLEVTTLRNLKTGSLVNLEVDVLAKYVETLLGRR
jgi:riboflavin synthase